MYLEKLEIQGFKSFAGKNTLVFPGKVVDRAGITAIVGPNGSGKSNIADAVRWALGEQSMKTLRGKKSEDIIFSGSDKKGKLGLSEVSLHLNNADGRVPLDYSQVLITRRLFRNGDSEYLLNGSRVRLLDIQMLLAQANFGQRTYSVIGQGVVEGFLNTSLAERKEFFDEATGVRQYQIKRDEALNKLKLSLENLNQSQMLLAEIEPRLRVLNRQMARYEKKADLTEELDVLQLDFYGRAWQEINGKLSEANQAFLAKEKIKRDKEKKLALLERDLATLEKQSVGSQDFIATQDKINKLQAQKDQLTQELAKLDAWLEVQLEFNGKFDLSFLNKKKQELAAALKRLAQDISLTESLIKNQTREVAETTRAKNDLSAKISQLSGQLQGLSEAGSDINQTAKKQLQQLLVKLERAETMSDLSQIRKLLAEIKEELRQFFAAAVGAEAALWQRDLLAAATQRETISAKLHEQSVILKTNEEKIKLLNEQQTKLTAELKMITDKLSVSGQSVSGGDKQRERQRLEKDLTALNQQLAELHSQVSETQLQQGAKHSSLFAVQKNLHNLQAEINALANELNEYKISAARHETRLEDLENEIRANGCELTKIRNYQIAAVQFNQEAVGERIRQLRRQLDAIGALDPEAAQEHQETKERYDFLSAQVADLTASIDSLQQIIGELDGLIKERFDKEFKVIEQKFQEYFKILFSGGSAKIIKVMLEETEEAVENEASFRDQTMKKLKALQRRDSLGLAGVDIMATPPGKKIQSLAMLSGGERALTAIALLCAIISANPSPFVILDEVDAALDEANSERLAKILDDLSHQTQFIAITHNRAVMRQANVLYGVTMGEDGVSKLLSIKLEDIKEK